MKNLKICVLAILVFATATLASLNATIVSVPTTTTTATTATKLDKKAQAQMLTARLHEIKAIDKSDLSVSEKKELRKETRAIKSQLRALSDGIYISVGGAIIIALLLILLL
jgi:CHASE3 domain sensor protein